MVLILAHGRPCCLCCRASCWTYKNYNQPASPPERFRSESETNPHTHTHIQTQTQSRALRELTICLVMGVAFRRLRRQIKIKRELSAHNLRFSRHPPHGERELRKDSGATTSTSYPRERERASPRRSDEHKSCPLGQTAEPHHPKQPQNRYPTLSPSSLPLTGFQLLLCPPFVP